jgi:hypothetical protein
MKFILVAALVCAVFCYAEAAKKVKVEPYCQWDSDDGFPVPVSHGGLGQLRGNGHGVFLCERALIACVT